jgi:hypothetical protein
MSTPGRIAPIFSFFLRAIFKFNFLVAPVTTPLHSMDFLTIFGLCIIPAKQQVLYMRLAGF